MRRLLIGILFALVVVVPVVAQPEAKSPYKIDFDQKKVELRHRSAAGEEGIYIRVPFNYSLDSKDGNVKEGDWQIVVEENGKKAKVLPLAAVQKGTADLSVILALDTSGSMKEHNRMAMARHAAETFLGKLPPQADCGLVLFDHEIRDAVAPTTDRNLIRTRIVAKDPRGGTAFRDAALKAIEMLALVPHGRDRALVLMTDGADVNSAYSLNDVITEAKKQNVKVFTIGIGEPGKFERVSTALVLDHSGSMERPADDADLSTPKIKALHVAASAFVQMMSEETGRISLIPFSSRVKSPRAFTNNKAALKKYITDLTPAGETAVFDAIYTGIATLQAENAVGKRAVVAMTDGIDNSSRRRVGEIIDRAKEAQIKLYLLGFGRKSEIDHTTMQRMATETGGKYFHATNKDALMKIFEELSIELHDDGIDEVSLRRIADETGGKYYPAKDVLQLKFILETVNKSLERDESNFEFKSLNQRDDGSLRRVALRLVRVGSEDTAIDIAITSYQVHGLLIAEMHPLIYLVLLAVLGGLIAAPAVLRRPGGGA